ncbi:MAG: 3-keto-5-aminohexanoate cleavage protein [Pseudomonadota bacterium]
MANDDVKPKFKGFDPSQFLMTAHMHAEGQVKNTPNVQFVMSVKSAIQAGAICLIYIGQKLFLFPAAA